MINQTAKELFIEYRSKAQVEVNKFCQIQVFNDPNRVFIKKSAQKLMCLTGLWQAIASRLEDYKYYQEG